VTGWPIVALAGGVKEMVCGARATGNTCVTGLAGRYWALPGWEAVITHWPAVQGTTVAPETVHTRGYRELYDTGRPVGESGPSNTRVHDDAVKTTGTPTVAPGTGPNEIRWAERSVEAMTWNRVKAWAGA
jgi:hypothetical protein